MNLPHQSPLIFAKKVVSKDEDSVKVFCDFNQVPTLSMFIEASAQGSSAFNDEEDEVKIGFLTTVKNIELLNEIKNNTYLIEVTKKIEINNIKQFTFEVFDSDTNIKIIVGSFTILVPNNDVQ